MKKIVIGILCLCLMTICIFAYKYFSKDKYITSEEAIQIAMDDVSNKDDKYNFSIVEFKEENNIYIYYLEFSDDINKYSYKINAKNKNIISSKKESLTNNKIYLSEDEILKKVFENAKLNKNDCNLISNLVTLEGNISVYNTVFFYNNIRYEYKINAYTGAIISVTKLKQNA